MSSKKRWRAARLVQRAPPTVVYSSRTPRTPRCTQRQTVLTWIFVCLTRHVTRNRCEADERLHAHADVTLRELTNVTVVNGFTGVAGLF